VRTVRVVGDEAAAVERRAGANARRLRRRRPHDERAAHAVALRPDLLGLVHLRLLIEPRDERGRVLFRRAGRADRRHQRLQLGHVRRILEAEGRGIFDRRRFLDAVERVRDEDRVAFGRDALADVAHRRTQPERVGPDEHRRMRAGGWINKCSVAGAVLGLDLDVLFRHRHVGSRRAPGGGGDAGADRNRHELAA
jgi:hypothetical protein